MEVHILESSVLHSGSTEDSNLLVGYFNVSNYQSINRLFEGPYSFIYGDNSARILNSFLLNKEGIMIRRNARKYLPVYTA
jgi:hypothetical protein